MSLFNILLHQPVSVGKRKELNKAGKNRVCACGAARWVAIRPSGSRVTAFGAPSCTPRGQPPPCQSRGSSPRVSHRQLQVASKAVIECPVMAFEHEILETRAEAEVLH